MRASSHLRQAKDHLAAAWRGRINKAGVSADVKAKARRVFEDLEELLDWARSLD